MKKFNVKIKEHPYLFVVKNPSHVSTDACYVRPEHEEEYSATYLVCIYADENAVFVTDALVRVNYREDLVTLLFEFIESLNKKYMLDNPKHAPILHHADGPTDGYIGSADLYYSCNYGNISSDSYEYYIDATMMMPYVYDHYHPERKEYFIDCFTCEETYADTDDSSETQDTTTDTVKSAYCVML